MQHDFGKHAAPALVYSVSLLYLQILGWEWREHHGNKMGMISDAIARYDDEHSFARSVTLPEEDRAKYTSVGWEGGYRWFRSPNVICLEKARRVRPLIEKDYFERL